MQQPLVTVVTPSYNQGSFIRATIESVLSQDYPHIEYIIMDGGSTDETASVAKEYSSRLTFISEKDRGQSHAINKGFHMARGGIVAWLNSDDVYLPGAVRHAVKGFAANPRAGAVYGEGYLIDRDGRITSRFPHTRPPDLWKLVHLSDYILQQTVYFRKAVLGDVGYLDEDLHYTMDWDILIRIAARYPLHYIPEYMGCLREYPEAKSSAGGQRRIRELRDMLRRHTGMRVPPGYIVYGLDTYQRIWCDRVASVVPARLRTLSEPLQAAIRHAAGLVVAHVVYNSQGLYTDGWAGRRIRYTLPPGQGPLLIAGTVPDRPWLRGQELEIGVNGKLLVNRCLPVGDFDLSVDLPQELNDKAVNLSVRASRWIWPRPLMPVLGGRSEALLLKSICRGQPAAGEAAQTVLLGC